jgi:hypothetical protein
MTVADLDDRQAARQRRLRDGLAGLKLHANGIDGERVLFLLGAVAVPLGFLSIGIAWVGVSGSGLLFEQMPYLVSGGLGGLGLIIVGAALYFSWWMTRSIRESREQQVAIAARHDALVEQQRLLLEAVHDLRRAVETQGARQPRRTSG